MQTVQIFLAVVVTLVCVGIGLYISRVNRGYERRKRAQAARTAAQPSPAHRLDTTT